MTNFLDNGTIMPHGLLSCNSSDFLRGFNKSYNNTALRFGVIKQIYSINDSGNVSKLSTEYDVDVIEQDMNRGVAPVTYKNCLSVDSLGSMADFFEKNFRAQTQSDNFQLPLTKGQNGATVLVLCLDATTGKGIVLGGLNHPNRTTNITNDSPQLWGEYNGVKINIAEDGSCSLSFNGPTNNDGTPVLPVPAAPTTFAVDDKGSFSALVGEFATVSADYLGNINMISTSPDANILIKGFLGAQLAIAPGTVALGANGIELLDLVDQTIKLQMQILDAINLLTVETILGPSSPPINSPQFSLLKQQLQIVDTKLNLIKGSLN